MWQRNEELNALWSQIMRSCITVVSEKLPRYHGEITSQFRKDVPPDQKLPKLFDFINCWNHIVSVVLVIMIELLNDKIRSKGTEDIW
jgi:hypothetical protein